MSYFKYTFELSKSRLKKKNNKKNFFQPVHILKVTKSSSCRSPQQANSTNDNCWKKNENLKNNVAWSHCGSITPAEISFLFTADICKQCEACGADEGEKEKCSRGHWPEVTSTSTGRMKNSSSLEVLVLILMKAVWLSASREEKLALITPFVSNGGISYERDQQNEWMEEKKKNDSVTQCRHCQFPQLSMC